MMLSIPEEDSPVQPLKERILVESIVTVEGNFDNI
jgi:hypothetical protein